MTVTAGVIKHLKIDWNSLQFATLQTNNVLSEIHSIHTVCIFTYIYLLIYFTYIYIHILYILFILYILCYIFVFPNINIEKKHSTEFFHIQFNLNFHASLWPWCRDIYRQLFPLMSRNPPLFEEAMKASRITAIRFHHGLGFLFRKILWKKNHNGQSINGLEGLATVWEFYQQYGLWLFRNLRHIPRLLSMHALMMIASSHASWIVNLICNAAAQRCGFKRRESNYEKEILEDHVRQTFSVLLYPPKDQSLTKGFINICMCLLVFADRNTYTISVQNFHFLYITAAFYGCILYYICFIAVCSVCIYIYCISIYAQMHLHLPTC